MAAGSITLKIIRLAMGGLFVFSGLAKIAHPDVFRASIAAYHILPASLEIPCAWFIPVLELLCGLALMAGFWVRGGTLVLQLLLAIFTLALGSAWARGLDVRCGCFGAWLEFGSYPWLIGRNVFLAYLARLIFRGLEVAGKRSL